MANFGIGTLEPVERGGIVDPRGGAEHMEMRIAGKRRRAEARRVFGCVGHLLQFNPLRRFAASSTSAILLAMVGFSGSLACASANLARALRRSPRSRYE